MTPLRQRMIEDMRIRKSSCFQDGGSNGCHSLSPPQIRLRGQVVHAVATAPKGSRPSEGSAWRRLRERCGAATKQGDDQRDTGTSRRSSSNQLSTMFTC